MSCGSSSRLVLRRKRPTRVTRGSSTSLKSGAGSTLRCASSAFNCSAFLTIVRNFHMPKRRPWSPVRCWRNTTAPGESRRIASAINASSGTAIGSATRHNTRSRTRARDPVTPVAPHARRQPYRLLKRRRWLRAMARVSPRSPRPARSPSIPWRLLLALRDAGARTGVGGTGAHALAVAALSGSAESVHAKQSIGDAGSASGQRRRYVRVGEAPARHWSLWCSGSPPNSNRRSPSWWARWISRPSMRRPGEYSAYAGL